MMPADVLSQVLSMVRLSGAHLFQLDVTAPWCIEAAPTAAGFAPVMAPGTNQLSAFHVLLEGHCQVRSVQGEWQALRVGEAVVLPQGGCHQIGDDPAAQPMAMSTALGGQSVLGSRYLHFGAGQHLHSRILCGFLGSDGSAFRPLQNALPTLFTVPLGQTVQPLLDYTLQALLQPRAGNHCMCERLAELLYLEALRVYIEALPGQATGWLAGLRDPLVGRALQLLHQAPAQVWTVNTLAARCASSRSVLAGRFTHLLQQAPMHYLAELRLQLAAQQLRHSRCSIEAVAAAAGYASTAAFHRAFKRSRGMAPGAWRRAQHG